MAIKHLWEKYEFESPGIDYVIKEKSLEVYWKKSFDYYSLSPSYNKKTGYLENRGTFTDNSGNSKNMYNVKTGNFLPVSNRSTRYEKITYVKLPTSSSDTKAIMETEEYIGTPKPFGKGAFITVITSDNKDEYPTSGVKDKYWYEYIGTDNKTPVIPGEDTNLGEKNKPFEIEYSVKDEDITDRVTIKEYLNNRLIRTIENSNNTNQTLKITSELLNSCPLGETNTIKIYAEDEKGAGTYRNYWFKRTNTPPYFAEENTDLGTVTKAPTITFTPKDDDGDKYLKAKVKINQRVVKTYEQLGNGEQVSFTLDWKDFMQLNHSRKHNLWVEVEDSSGALATLKYTFERDTKKIEIVTNTAPLDIKIKLIVFNANIKLGEGATFLQYACNDFGTGNTWEKIQNGVPYGFTNKHEGEDVIGYKCELTKGTGESEIRSIGGSFI